MTISQIFAITENNVIGHDNKLIWHLPLDLKFFKSKTLGHPIIMGRKTFESLGKPLPGRTNIVLTNNTNYVANGCIVVNSMKEAILEAHKVEQNEIFIIGGAAVFYESMPFTDKIYLTEVKAHLEGNVTFKFDKSLWQEAFREDHFKDEKHAYDYSFVELLKKK